MNGHELAKRITDLLPAGRVGLFNPWRDVCPEDEIWNSPEEKLVRLGEHFNTRPKLILCGEAAGYQGKRHSGMAFTSERLVMEGSIPRIASPGKRLTNRKLPYSEPSATIVWRTLYRLQLAEVTVMWNALPMHPYPGDDPCSNRTPTDAELEIGKAPLQMLVGAFPEAKVVAVGRKAEGLLASMGVTVFAAVRHPANGGATAFASGMADVSALLM